MAEHHWIKAGRQIYSDGLYQRYRCNRCGKLRKGERVVKFEKEDEEW